MKSIRDELWPQAGLMSQTYDHMAADAWNGAVILLNRLMLRGLDLDLVMEQAVFEALRELE